MITITILDSIEIKYETSRINYEYVGVFEIAKLYQKSLKIK